jgi:hypothetical protein
VFRPLRQRRRFTPRCRFCVAPEAQFSIDWIVAAPSRLKSEKTLFKLRMGWLLSRARVNEEEEAGDRRNEAGRVGARQRGDAGERRCCSSAAPFGRTRLLSSSPALVVDGRAECPEDALPRS